MKAKNIALWALGALLVISLVFNGLQFAWAQGPGGGIVGTFVNGVEYLVFDQDGGYMLYRQWEEPLEQGTYETFEDDTCRLVSQNGDASEVLFVGDMVYRTSPEGHFLPYERISDLPVYINVPGRMPGPAGASSLP